ncbi:hypothetical protein [Fulvimonas soli]|jgi:hypothetical protein|uniref:Lipoprotein n=1 Tax=Fulvimonas soli TaxID=155197 RepID=A0A316IF76_9GAMM|nr:hypothetical protein [Fulvimonas soli]PWK85914.1 hypothetical protein C7456_108210 [Fulvimonas soli]TNY25965.1 hypothetical protein BV497_11245 [Fulvimonas soli]
MKRSLRPVLPALLGLGLLAGCSSSGDQSAAPAQTAQQAGEAEAAGKLDTYRQLLRIKNDEMAVSMGHDILERYPGSAAAKEVQQTLPAIEKRWKENSEKARLAGLWVYQVSPMEGGTQSTATIYTSQPSGNDRVRLVLRRHTAWGQNAFLFGGGHGFVCRGNCTVPTEVDGKRAGIKAFAPPTGEPALMIRDDKAFIAQLAKAKKISMDVTLVDGEKKETLVFEVGGFDPGKWQPLPKGKK